MISRVLFLRDMTLTLLETWENLLPWIVMLCSIFYLLLLFHIPIISRHSNPKMGWDERRCVCFVRCDPSIFSLILKDCDWEWEIASCSPRDNTKRLTFLANMMMMERRLRDKKRWTLIHTLPLKRRINAWGLRSASRHFSPYRSYIRSAWLDSETTDKTNKCLMKSLCVSTFHSFLDLTFDFLPSQQLYLP